MRIDGVQQVRESKYIMLHAPRSALPEIRRLLPGSESPTIIPLEGSSGPGGRARGVPRERVLGDAREPEEGRRQRPARAAGREDVGLSPCAFSTGSSSRRASGAPRWRARRRTSRADIAAVAREVVDTVRARRRCGAARLHRALRWRGAGRAGRIARRSLRAARDAADADADRRPRARHRQCRAGSIARSCPSPSRGDHARRALRADHPADPGRGTVCAGRLGAAALRRDHAGGSGAHRRLPAARAVHAAAAATARANAGGAGGRRSCAASRRSSRSAARRRSPRSPTAPAAIPKVDKIFGPGNAWVTAAKQLVAADPAGAACDLPAGPSEVMVIADDTRARGVRRGGPAGAGRARRAGAGASWSRPRAQLAEAGRGARSRRRLRRAVAARDSRRSRSAPAAASWCRTCSSAIDVANAYAPSISFWRSRAAARG